MGGGVILNSDKKAKNVPITTKVKKFKSRCFFSVFEQKSFDSWKTKKIRKKNRWWAKTTFESNDFFARRSDLKTNLKILSNFN